MKTSLNAPLRMLIGLVLVTALHGQDSEYSLRFYGNGVDDIDRVKIQIDDPDNNAPGPPADIGAEDFTMEFWIKALASENLAPQVSCGNKNNWILGNIIIDRDRFSQDRDFGVSIAGGVIFFGVSGEGKNHLTICGKSNVLDGEWRHIAAQRRLSDGKAWLYVDGVLEAEGTGATGDLSYPDDGVPGNFCNGPCTNSDPYFVIGAEKHDAGSRFPSFSGYFDELRLSNILRYTDNFSPTRKPFVTDSNTVALYHFNEGTGDTINDVSGANGGPSNGVRRFGGSPSGPEWSVETPFDTTLPVALNELSLHITAERYILLNWKTVPEFETSGFEVQRKGRADRDFVTLPGSFVAASALVHEYTYTDKSATTGKWFYRLKQINSDGAIRFLNTAQIEVTVSGANPPETFSLLRNFPNPFNAGTSIHFNLSVAGKVNLSIYSLQGKKVRTLLDEQKSAGKYIVKWQAVDDKGREVPSGVYFQCLKTGSVKTVGKMLLIR